MTPPARRKRVWKVADFAAHAGLTHRTARRVLLRLHRKHGGRLLSCSDGRNREYTFLPATLARLEPDLFAPIEGIEFRLEEVEEVVASVVSQQKRQGAQLGENTRQIVQLQLFAEESRRKTRPSSTSVGQNRGLGR